MRNPVNKTSVKAIVENAWLWNTRHTREKTISKVFNSSYYANLAGRILQISHPFNYFLKTSRQKEMGLHKAIIPFYPIGNGYKKDFKEAAAVAAATAKMPNFIKLPQPAP